MRELTREEVIEIGSWFTDPNRCNITRDAARKVCALVGQDTILRARLEVQTKRAEDAIAEQRMLDNKYVDERAAKLDAESERDNWERCLGIEKREHATALNERDTARQQVADLTAKLAVSEQRVSDLQHEIKELSGYNDVVTQERDIAEQQLAAAQETIAQLESERDMWQNSCEQSREIVGCLGKDNQVLQSTLTAQREEIGRLRGGVRDCFTLGRLTNRTIFRTGNPSPGRWQDLIDLCRRIDTDGSICKESPMRTQEHT